MGADTAGRSVSDNWGKDFMESDGMLMEWVRKANEEDFKRNSVLSRVC